MFNPETLRLMEKNTLFNHVINGKKYNPNEYSTGINIEILDLISENNKWPFIATLENNFRILTKNTQCLFKKEKPTLDDLVEFLSKFPENDRWNVTEKLIKKFLTNEPEDEAINTVYFPEILKMHPKNIRYEIIKHIGIKQSLNIVNDFPTILSAYPEYKRLNCICEHSEFNCATIEELLLIYLLSPEVTKMDEYVQYFKKHYLDPQKDILSKINGEEEDGIEILINEIIQLELINGDTIKEKKQYIKNLLDEIWMSIRKHFRKDDSGKINYLEPKKNENSKQNIHKKTPRTPKKEKFSNLISDKTRLRKSTATNLPEFENIAKTPGKKTPPPPSKLFAKKRTSKSPLILDHQKSIPTITADQNPTNNYILPSATIPKKGNSQNENNSDLQQVGTFHAPEDKKPPTDAINKALFTNESPTKYQPKQPLSLPEKNSKTFTNFKNLKIITIITILAIPLSFIAGIILITLAFLLFNPITVIPTLGSIGTALSWLFFAATFTLGTAFIVDAAIKVITAISAIVHMHKNKLTIELENKIENSPPIKTLNPNNIIKMITDFFKPKNFPLNKDDPQVAKITSPKTPGKS